MLLNVSRITESQIANGNEKKYVLVVLGICVLRVIFNLNNIFKYKLKEECIKFV